jgi:chromosome segregation ATPase
MNFAETMGRRKREREQMAASIAALTAEIESLRNQLTQQVSDVASATGTTSALLSRVASIETSVSNLGSELSRQLHELGSDLENLSRSSDNDMTATIDQIRSSQVRLASEQARYEIAFRQDLAGLAEEIRRQTRG